MGLLGVGVDCLSFFLILHFFTADILVAQVFSFMVAVTHNFILNKYWTFKKRGNKETASQYLKFFFVSSLALGLRTGVIAQCLKWEFPPFLSLLAGIGSGTSINFLGSREWAFSRRKGVGCPDTTNSDFLIWSFIFFLFLIRFVYAALIELSPEEAYYWNYAMHPALSYFDHPPMVAWVIRTGTLLFGNTEIGVRLGGIFLAMGSTYLIYFLGTMWFNKKSGLIAALLFQIIPIYFIYGFNVTPDIPLLFFWLLTLYYVSVAVQKDKSWAWFVAGGSLGCTMLSKYTGVMLIPSTFLFLVLNRPYRKWLLKKEPYIALLISLLVFSPVIVWNYHYYWASFIFQFSRRFSEHAAHPLLSFLEFFGSQMGVLFPPFFFGLLLVFVISFRLSIKAGGPKWQFSFLYSFPLLAIFTFYSFKSEVKVNWTLPAYLSLLSAVYPGYRHVRLKAKRKLRAVIQGTTRVSVCLLPVIFLMFLYHLSIGIPSIPAFPKLGGWEELEKAVGNEETAMSNQTGKDPFLIGDSKYFIPAELAFYMDDPYDTFSSYLLGGKGMAFKYWTDKKSLKNRDALVVSKRFPNLSLLKKYFSRVDKRIKQIVIARQGQIIRYFYLARCYSYSGQK